MQCGLTCMLKCTMRWAASESTRFWGWLRRGPRVSSCHSGFCGCRSFSVMMASCAAADGLLQWHRLRQEDLPYRKFSDTNTIAAGC